MQGSEAVAQVVGPGIGGLLVQAFRAPFALVVDAASYLASALALVAIRDREPKPQAVGHRSLHREIAEGTRYVIARPVPAGADYRAGGGQLLLRRLRGNQRRVPGADGAPRTGVRGTPDRAGQPRLGHRRGAGPDGGALGRDVARGVGRRTHHLTGRPADRVDDPRRRAGVLCHRHGRAAHRRSHLQRDGQQLPAVVLPGRDPGSRRRDYALRAVRDDPARRPGRRCSGQRARDSRSRVGAAGRQLPAGAHPGRLTAASAAGPA
ncbi:MAG: hypothetical protein DLM58_23865 [Pseudonocardiales bacterium]|nr:MAG: hypothetical protein DLM58_23865 [Pseudonocardiales bacterium]